MRRIRTAATRVLVAVALAHGFTVGAADIGVRAEARRPALSPGRELGDPEVASFNLSFDLHVMNGSSRPIRLPVSRPRSATSVRFALIGLDSKLSDGTWAHLIQASVYDNGSLTYEPCGSVPPQAADDVNGLETQITLLKKQLKDLDEDQTVRLHVMLFCKQPNGRVLTEELTTQAFQVRLHI